MLHARLAVVTAVTAFAVSSPAQNFVNYENGPIHPIRISADGSRLFVADTVGGRLCVFDLGVASAPFLVAEIPVGLDPVSVNPRTRDEVWVTNLLGDCVSIVDVSQRRVIDTLRVVDEPSDVVFAGGKAFVSAATTDLIEVFDAATRAHLGTIPVFGKDPRALAVSPNGAFVYAVVHRSGNGTILVPHTSPSAAQPTVGLATPPLQGDIQFAPSAVLPDQDVAEISVATMQVNRYFTGVGTTNTAIAVHPTSGDLWVTNIQARNWIRFEPNVKGHAIDSCVTKITTSGSPMVTPFDLNPGINYQLLPNPAALSDALAEPFGVAIDAAAGRVYVAAHGTDRIGVLDLAGNVLTRIEVGGTSGTTVNTRQKRGPRGLALHPTQARLYVLNRLTDTLSVIDTANQTVLNEQPIATVDPMPVAMREGRKFLYDAKLSGNGTMSCASCHIDGDIDGLAWDLGDSLATMSQVVWQLFPGNPQPVPFSFHPMKGPMTTQTLRGMAGNGPLHWRGDKATFQDFNGAFASLLGGSQIPTQDMDDYADFAMEIAMPPNPNQALDRQDRTLPLGNNEAAGRQAFVTPPPNVFFSCATCHALPSGSDGLIQPITILAGEPQDMKTPHLRNMYRKVVGFDPVTGKQKSGFGFMHDGAVMTLTDFLLKPVFSVFPAATKDDLETFLMAFDTGTAPAVGVQYIANQVTAPTQALLDAFGLTSTRAVARDLDLVAHGIYDGRLASLYFDHTNFFFRTDRANDLPIDPISLHGKVVAGTANLTFTAVTPGTGLQFTGDRDGDTVLDGDELASDYGAATPGCAGEAVLRANSEARQGNAQFGLTMENAPPNSQGLLLIGITQAGIPWSGVTLLVDPATALMVPTTSDAHGFASYSHPITPATPPGLVFHLQSLWLDACGSAGWSATRGLTVPTRP